MSNVIDFVAKRAEREKPSPVHEDPFIRVYDDGSLEYTEAGLSEFREPFEYAGFDIENIASIKEHTQALDNIRFSVIPPYN